MKKYPDYIKPINDYCYRTDCLDCRLNILDECMLVNENCRIIVIDVNKENDKHYQGGGET